MNNETGNNSSFPLFIKLKIIKEFGYVLSPESLILDFGCGSGRMVEELRASGYKAFGCGTRFNADKNIDTASMMKEGILCTIDFSNYKLPFNDNSVDFIYSHSVFEHVRNYNESIAEIARILKPDGYCLHFFASRFRLIEPHVYVPLSSVIQSRWWLYFWALVGVRNEWTEGLNAKEASIQFYKYLQEETNYLTKKQLRLQFEKHFEDVIFCENLLLKYSPKRGKYLYALSKLFPFITHIYSTFNIRVILTRKPSKAIPMNK